MGIQGKAKQKQRQVEEEKPQPIQKTAAKQTLWLRCSLSTGAKESSQKGWVNTLEASNWHAGSHYFIVKQRENPERFEQEHNIIKTALINECH